MKTPEEIKSGLGCCLKGFCTSCAYEKILNCTESVREDALALIQRLEAQVPKWISVEERLPENKQMVIGFTPCDGYMFVGYYREEQNWKQWYIVTAMRSTKYVTKKVTHWMPLPEPPKEEEK